MFPSFYHLAILYLFTSVAILSIRQAIAQNINSTENGNPISVFDHVLVLANPATPRGTMSAVDDLGYLKVISEPWVQTFSLDVGFNRGQTSFGWLDKLNNLFVIGVEANHLLVTHFEHNPEFDRLRSREIIILGAAGTKHGTALFNPGFGWDNASDVGSLYGWTDANREAERKKHVREHMQVRFVRLEDILEHVPPPTPGKLIWDTLKIDVQGADVDALISAGDHVKKFLCVVGEFDARNYNVPSDVPMDPVPFLKEKGFVRVNNYGNQVWFNPIYVEEYRRNATRFGCHLVYDSILDPGALISAYDKGGA
jgi:FkbM family methyltransferase